MLDLADLNLVTAASRPTRTELEHPATGKPLLDEQGDPYYIEHLGDDAPEVRKIDRRQNDRRSERIRKNKDAGLDTETLEQEAAERLAAATVSWYLPPLKGETLPFTHKNAMRVYTDDAFAWIPEQMGRSMKDRKRFFDEASTT